MAVTANITVSFGTSKDSTVDGHLSAEIDDREDGLNGGNTSFAPGDTAHFLVYKSANVTYDDPIASAGGVSAGSTGILVTKEDDITFANTDTASLSIPAEAIILTTWIGTSLGELDLIDTTTLKASAKGVAVARVKYSAKADAFAIASPESVGGLTDFSILVFILGHIAGVADEEA